MLENASLMHISAKIEGITYKHYLPKELISYRLDSLSGVLDKHEVFKIRLNNSDELAVSWWVSAKRTRSYPYARVYDTLRFQGRKVTILPIFKDEGSRGDRDFLQWDTISLMSLLEVYVIISYYKDAVRSSRYSNKITDQRFDIKHILEQIESLRTFKSSALHWNMLQIDAVGEIASQALVSYKQISQKTGVRMHSEESAKKRITKLKEAKDVFMKMSRDFAERAQKREAITLQPKEKLSGRKATITIQNYLGGVYYFTVDEAYLNGNSVYLIEGKHTKSDLPSDEDIKDGLIKMILFCNLVDVRVGHKSYKPKPVLKLTTIRQFDKQNLNEHKAKLFEALLKEAHANNFQIQINSKLVS